MDCLICGKPDCHATLHSLQEQIDGLGPAIGHMRELLELACDSEEVDDEGCSGVDIR